MILLTRRLWLGTGASNPGELVSWGFDSLRVNLSRGARWLPCTSPMGTRFSTAKS
jgi:hypothetical protein